MTVGELIRERRMAQSLSLGQLATKLGVAAAAVRQWERNEEFPPEALRSELGSVLDLDPAEFGPVVTERELPVTTNDSAAPVDVVTQTLPQVGVAVAEITDPGLSQVAAGDHAVEMEPSGVVTAEESADVAAIITGPRDVFAPDGDVDEHLGGGNGEVAASARGAVSAPAASQPAMVMIEHIPYWRDPKQRWRYVLRWVLLTIALAALGYALVWALRELIEALGPVLDSIDFDSGDEVPAEAPIES